MSLTRNRPQGCCVERQWWMEEGKGQACEKKREFGDSYCIDLYINV